MPHQRFSRRGTGRDDTVSFTARDCGKQAVNVLEFQGRQAVKRTPTSARLASYEKFSSLCEPRTPPSVIRQSNAMTILWQSIACAHQLVHSG